VFPIGKMAKTRMNTGLFLMFPMNGGYKA